MSKQLKSRCRLFHRWRLDKFFKNQSFLVCAINLECKRCGKKKIDWRADWLDTDRALNHYRWLDIKDEIGRIKGEELKEK